MLVRDLPKDDQIVFVSDSQDVRFWDDYLGVQHGEYNSYFLLIGDGDCDEAWGLEVTVPWLDAHVWKVR